MFVASEERYAVIERLMKGAKQGNNDDMAELIQNIEPMIVTCCRYYFGYIDEDLMQQGRMRCITLVTGFDMQREIRFLGYMKKMLSCYFWEQKKDHIKLCENEVFMTKENENYINNRSFVELGYEDIDMVSLLGGLTSKEREIIIKNVIGREKLKAVALGMGISYYYSKDIKKSALLKLRKILVVD